MALAAAKLHICLLMLLMATTTVNVSGQATWCVARSDASNQALQTALDYACGSGADCFPLQSNGLCFLPNTIQAHASYAFNSFYQRKGRAPGSCDFSGTATIAQSDPSYGSCVYPSSGSTAGGGNTPSTTPAFNNPNVPSPTTTTPIFGGGNSGGLTPGMNTPFPDNSRAASEATATWFLVLFPCLVILATCI
ncbi:hypothetical protein PIB30_014211 [Stylosanthes scabra]|uniref:X8 domain-containing protein n=1 Tax=Stylosanthes scabra TaxID=79078 RepID=A0ABU6W4Q9_9FABA|nr:hypothetical protein [Stylosanthes scabra]